MKNIFSSRLLNDNTVSRNIYKKILTLVGYNHKNEKADKIAICFYGLTRSLPKTIDSLKKNLFSQLDKAGRKYDIYVHTYNVKKINNARSGEKNCENNPEDYKLLNPDFFKIDSQDKLDVQTNYNNYLTHGCAWGDNYVDSTKNLIRQLNSLKEVTKLWTSKGNRYSLVIYLRMDLELINSLKLIDICISERNNILGTCSWQKFGGLNDRIYFAPPNIAKIIGNRLDFAHSYSQKNKLHSEKFLKYIVSLNNIKTFDIDLFGIRVRANGEKDKRDVEMSKRYINL